MRTFVKIICFITIILSSALLTRAQDADGFFNNQSAKTTWLGIDFSETRVMGDAGATPAEMKDRYFVSINEVVISEPEKYDIGKVFRKTNVSNNIAMISKVNGKIDESTIKTYESSDMNRLTPELIEKMVSRYDFGDMSGYGIVFIMEGMNKTAPLASMYVTIVNMDKKKMVATKHMTAKPMGFGFRNYWAKTVYEVLKDIEKKGYSEMQTDIKK
jgi:hypothetical protein